MVGASLRAGRHNEIRWLPFASTRRSTGNSRWLKVRTAGEGMSGCKARHRDPRKCESADRPIAPFLKFGGMPGFMEANHPERRRDGPDEAAATSGSIPPGANARSMRRQFVAFIEALSCRECARIYPAEALHVCDYCFGPLEVSYDYEAIAEHVTAESIAAGPQTIWRYADLLPV